MRDEDKAKEQLISELLEARNRVAELEALEVEYQRVKSDITEQVRAEEALRRAEQEKEAILDSMSELVAYQDSQMKILWANRAAGESVGLAPEQLVGRHCYAIWNRRDDLCADCPVEKALKTGQPQEGEMTTPDGRVWFIRGYPVRDANGEVVGLVEVALEITERKRVGETLRESEEKYRTLFEASTDAIFLETLEGRVLDCNASACEMFGCTKEELIGLTVADLVPEEVARTLPDVIAEHLKTGGIFVETFNERRNGQVFPCEVSTRLVTAGGEQLVIVYVRDITERRRLEEQFRQAQKMEAVGRLAGGMAHDFNNLLTAITGYSELLLHSLGDHDPLRQDVEAIRKAGERAASLTRQLLAFSRRQPLQPKVLDLNAVVADMGKMLRRLIGEDIELITVLEPGLGRVQADPGQIEQVIMNLAVNARDAMPRGGRLTIMTENVTLDEDNCQVISDARPGKFVRLSIADTGVGMDEEIMQHLFEPFFSTKKEGTGLGLSVVYGIVKQHEGWINVDSEPGQGSTFKVYLPALAVELEDETEEMISLQELQGGGKRVLVVEDEEGIREFVRRALGKNGYVVFEAASAGEALDVFEREGGNFHLVFSDVILSDIDGLQLVDQLLSRQPELRVMLSSGYTDRKSQWPLMRQRGFRFLQKPYALPDLLQAIREAIEPGQGDEG